jgi:hypothetical protein
MVACFDIRASVLVQLNLSIRTAYNCGFHQMKLRPRVESARCVAKRYAGHATISTVPPLLY